MQGKSVLLVDTDARSLRVLEVSLRRAGFEVRSASTGREALAAALEAAPDIVVTETSLPDFDGFELCHRLTADPSTAGINLLVLSEERSPEAKIRAISAGADDYLAKPIFVKEIVGRIRALVERRERDSLAKGRTNGFQGALANIGFVDLFQLVETGSKTCVLYVRATPEKSGGFVDRPSEGRIYFRDGVVIDAELGELRAEAAIYRMLLFTDGDFELEFTRLEREERVESPTQTILLEGMRRVDEWTRLEPTLPPLSTVLDVDFLALGERVRSLPREVEALLKLVDGKRTILRLVDESGLDDLRALSTVQKLLQEGLLVDRGRVSAVDGAQPALDAWLKTAPVPVPARTRSYSQVDLPSTLGNALIPAPAGASQLFRAVDPLAHSTAIPEPLPEPAGRPSADPIPLTRRKVGAGGGEAPVPLEKPVTAVPLTVRRVGSMVAKSGAAARALEAEVAEPEVLLAVDAALAEVAKEIRPARPAAIPSIPPGALPTPSVPPPALAAPAPAEPSKPSLPPRLPPPSDPAPPLAPEPTVEVERPALAAPAPKPAAPRAPSPAPRAPAPAARAPAPAAPARAATPRPAVRLEDDLIGEPPPAESERASPVVLGILGLGMVAVVGLAAYLFVFQPKQAHVDEYGRPVTDTIPMPPPKAAWPVIPEDGPAKAPAAPTAPAGTAATPAPATPAPAPAAAAPAAPAAAAPAAAAAPPAPTAAPAAAAPTAPAAASPAPAAPVAAAPAKPPVVAVTPVVAPAPPKVDLAPMLDRGDQALKAERLGDARAAFGEALAKDPKNARALSGLAFAAFSEDKLAEARQLAARSIAANPNHGRAHGVLGWVELAEEKPEPALKHFKLYLKLEPNGPMARDIKAQVAELQKP